MEVLANALYLLRYTVQQNLLKCVLNFLLYIKRLVNPKIFVCRCLLPGTNNPKVQSIATEPGFASSRRQNIRQLPVYTLSHVFLQVISTQLDLQYPR